MYFSGTLNCAQTRPDMELEQIFASLASKQTGAILRHTAAEPDDWDSRASIRGAAGQPMRIHQSAAACAGAAVLSIRRETQKIGAWCRRVACAAARGGPELWRGRASENGASHFANADCATIRLAGRYSRSASPARGSWRAWHLSCLPIGAPGSIASITGSSS